MKLSTEDPQNDCLNVMMKLQTAPCDSINKPLSSLVKTT